MRSVVIPSAMLLIAVVMGCSRKSARPVPMSTAEAERAGEIAGMWSSSQDDIGFVLTLKAGAGSSFSLTTVRMNGLPESAAGDWGVRGNSIVLHPDSDSSEIVLTIKESSEKTMVLSTPAGQRVPVKAAMVINSPRN